MKKVLIVAVICSSCSSMNDRLSPGLFPLEGNWKIAPHSPSVYIYTDSYEEIYFSKEFYYLCGELGSRNPRRYFSKKDSVFIEDDRFYFKIKTIYQDSILVEFENSENYLLSRLDTDEFMFDYLTIDRDQEERIYLNMIRRMQKAKLSRSRSALPSDLH